MKKMDERRKHPRVDVSFPLECTSLPSRGYFCTVSKDLALGGVRIISNNFIAKGDSFKLNINLIDKVVDCKAEVVWCSKQRVAERYAAGLKITEINPLHRKELSSFISNVTGQ
ncbi:MAG: hypothetical protein GF375_06160 [Candidatus Omnitrophica bacterium]|nr:hypothetical protein [Candidatus Omnitrophota bacterium]MBD3269559.1 hypothetical protein [Candidatus Omnitrophota bacterium]